MEKLNCIDGITIEMRGGIKALKHQDYHGKSIEVVIRDEEGNTVDSKIDIGVHKHLDIDQEEYCFDVCMDDEGATLLKNTIEQYLRRVSGSRQRWLDNDIHEIADGIGRYSKDMKRSYPL